MSCGCNNPCNPCQRNMDCDDLVLAWVPNTKATLGVTHGEASSTVDLTDMITNAQTNTHMSFSDEGCIQFQNEQYISSNGVLGELETICVSQFGPYLKLEDLSDVSGDPDHCSLLVYNKIEECGPNCVSKNNAWRVWNASDNEVDRLHTVAGFADGGCLENLVPPTNTGVYWFAGWRGGSQFGYYRPTAVSALPKNSSGETMVLSQNSNGAPIYGPINNQFREWLDESVCTHWIPAPGFEIATDSSGSGANSFCYFPNRGVAKCGLDLFTTNAMPAQTVFDLHVATLADARLYPNLTGGYYDFPVNPIWANNSDGEILPMMYRIDKDGRLLMSGKMTARGASGKTKFVVLGLDSTIDYAAKGV